MSDQNETLLKIKADASEVVREAAKAVTAIKSVDAAERGLADAPKAELLGDTSDLQKGAKAVEKVADATEDAGSAFENSSRHANTLAEVVSKIDPRLGDLVRTGGKLDEVMSAAFSPAGLMTGGLLVALTAVSAVVGSIQESIAKAQQDLADMEAARARFARDKLEAAGEVGQELAKRGVGSEGALTRATEQAQKTEAEGFERSAAVQVAGASEAAGLSLTDEERRRLTMGVQLGAVDLGKGRTPTETRAALEKAMGGLGALSPDLQTAIEAGIEQTMRGKNLGAMREAEKGTQGFLEDALRKMGFEGDTLADKAAKVRGALKGPEAEKWTLDDFGNPVSRPETQAEFERLNAEGLGILERLRQ